MDKFKIAPVSTAVNKIDPSAPAYAGPSKGSLRRAEVVHAGADVLVVNAVTTPLTLVLRMDYQPDPRGQTIHFYEEATEVAVLHLDNGHAVCTDWDAAERVVRGWIGRPDYAPQWGGGVAPLLLAIFKLRRNA